MKILNKKFPFWVLIIGTFTTAMLFYNLINEYTVATRVSSTSLFIATVVSFFALLLIFYFLYQEGEEIVNISDEVEVREKNLSLKTEQSEELIEDLDVLEVQESENETKTILLVEDNLINQKLALNMLEKFHLEVTIANNGLEALKIYKERNFSMILMDIHMPVMTGIDATEQIIAYEKETGRKHTPIVALTADNLEKSVKKYVEIGMDDYMFKPLTMSVLESVVKKYIYKNSSENKKILLYKKTEVEGKIYSAILKNIGYEVDAYSSTEKFREQCTNTKYNFMLFDKNIIDESNQELVFSMLETSPAVPFVFSETDEYKEHCQILNPKVCNEELRRALERF